MQYDYILGFKFLFIRSLSVFCFPFLCSPAIPLLFTHYLPAYFLRFLCYLPASVLRLRHYLPASVLLFTHYSPRTFCASHVTCPLKFCVCCVSLPVLLEFAAALHAPFRETGPRTYSVFSPSALSDINTGILTSPLPPPPFLNILQYSLYDIFSPAVSNSISTSYTFTTIPVSLKPFLR